MRRSEILSSLPSFTPISNQLNQFVVVVVICGPNYCGVEAHWSPGDTSSPRPTASRRRGPSRWGSATATGAPSTTVSTWRRAAPARGRLYYTITRLLSTLPQHWDEISNISCFLFCTTHTLAWEFLIDGSSLQKSLLWRFWMCPQTRRLCG